MVLTLQQDKTFPDKPSIYQIVQYHPPSASHRILKSLGLEKVREDLENLSLQKGKVLEFKPKKTEGLKAPLKTKSRFEQSKAVRKAVLHLTQKICQHRTIDITF